MKLGDYGFLSRKNLGLTMDLHRVSRFLTHSMRISPIAEIPEGRGRECRFIRGQSRPQAAGTGQQSLPLFMIAFPDVRLHPSPSDRFSAGWLVPNLCPGATLPGTTPTALGRPCGAARVWPGDVL